MNIRLWALAISCIFVGIAKADDLKGVIYNKQTKEPIVAAVVQAINSKNTAITDNKGSFILRGVSSSDQLKVTCLGFKHQLIPVQGQQNIQLAMEPLENHLNEIVVTANREQSLRRQTPISISKVSAKTIDETKATSAYEILNKAPGVLMVDLGNEQHFMSIRQPMSTSNYYLYLEDGLPIRPMGVFNHNALLEVNQFSISSIEVVKGPASSIYGPEAIGGTVNFIGQRPTTVPTAKVGIQFNNFGYRRLQFGTGATFGKFGFYLGGLTSRQTNSWLTNSDYDKTSINSRLEYHFSPKTRLTGTLVYSNYDSQTGGTADSIAFFSRKYQSNNDFSYRKSKAIRSRLTLEQDWNKNSNTSFTAFFRDNDLGQNPSYRISWKPSKPNVASGEINSNRFRSYGGLVQHHQKFAFLNSKLIAGALYDYSPNDYDAYYIALNPELRADGLSVEKYTIKEERPDSLVSNYNAKINNAAAYLQYDFKPTTKLTVSVGVRYDNMYFSYQNFIDDNRGSKRYQQFTPKVGATYNLSETKGFYANFSQGFAPPALTSIFRKSPSTNQFYYDLEAADFDNYELGGWASFFRNKLTIDLAAYLMKGQNELLSVRQADNSYEYQSAGETLHRGLELGINARPLQELAFRFGGTVALHRFEDFAISETQNLAGYEMPSAPRYTWNTELSYYPDWLGGFRTSLEWQYVGEFYQNQVNTLRYEGYELLNLRLGYRWKSIEVFTNVINLTDQLYATNVSSGNKATDRTSYTPAAPRTYVMGIQYNFTGKHK